MSVHHRDCGHRVRQQPLENRVERVAPKVGRGHGMVEVEAVAVEFGNCGGGEDDAGGVAEFEDVECLQECLTETGGQAVVGWAGEGEDVDLVGRRGADDAAGLFAILEGAELLATRRCMDGDLEESCWRHCYLVDEAVVVGHRGTLMAYRAGRSLLDLGPRGLSRSLIQGPPKLVSVARSPFKKDRTHSE